MEIRRILGGMKSQSIFLVTGKRSYSDSGAGKALSDVLEGLEVKRFIADSNTPELETIRDGVKLLLEKGADAVIAVGGGNVIDTAKAIDFFHAAGTEPDEESLMKSFGNLTDKIPLIAVPTTSGSGSEATHFAVVYSKGKKYSLAHKSVLPDYSVVDPELTYSLSPYLTAVSGIDAYCQAVESIWACGSTGESMKYAEEAIALAENGLNKAVNNPDSTARSIMSEAAHLAGMAINISKTTAPHALSYTLTSEFGVPHGQAVCISLGEFLKYNSEVSDSDCNDSRGPEHVKDSIRRIIAMSSTESAGSWAEKFSGLLRSTGLKTTLRDLGINNDDQLQHIAENTNAERLGNNPRKITTEGLFHLLKRIY